MAESAANAASPEILSRTHKIAIIGTIRNRTIAREMIRPSIIFPTVVSLCGAKKIEENTSAPVTATSTPTMTNVAQIKRSSLPLPGIALIRVRLPAKPWEQRDQPQQPDQTQYRDCDQPSPAPFDPPNHRDSEVDGEPV